MRRSRSQQPPSVSRAGWSSGARRRRMWVTVDGGHTRPPVRGSGAPEPGEPAEQPERPGRSEQPGHAGGDPRWYAGPRSEEPTRRLDPEADAPTEATARHRADPGEPDGTGEPRRPAGPSKLTVTRVVAWRSRELTGQGIRAWQRAATADGADRSGLTALTYATMFNFANDAAIAVALANTLFFSAATAESKTKVALYLLITVAPFALIAPVIGPLLDRLQRGRRMALAASFVGRGVLAVVMAMHFDDWGLYPAALGVMVLSKSFTVLRAAVTPRVLPEAITLVTTNSRLTTFGMVAGAVFGAGAAGFAALTGSQGALYYTAALCVVGVWLCLRIPAWVEVTSGEVPASMRGRPRGARRRQPMGRRVVVSLWANSALRLLTGFLTLFVAFVVKAQTAQAPREQLLLLGVVGAGAGLGAFLGNAVGARARFERSDAVVFGCVGAGVASAVAVAVLPGIPLAAVCALVSSTASALAKVGLDAVIQRDLPERSRASAFGRSETVLQLAWVCGGAMGVLLPPVYWIGFLVVAGSTTLVGLQAVLVARGGSVLPWIRYREQPEPVQRVGV